MSGHTALPWRSQGPDMYGDYNILHETDALAVAAVVSNMRPHVEVWENAALLVRACNNHESMVAALEEIVSMHLGDCPASMDEVDFARAHCNRIRRIAHKALSEATGR